MKKRENEIQIKFLLADFNAVKMEIARRSDQQKTALLLYITGVSYLFIRIASDQINYFYVLATWIMSLLVMTFIYRESLEIGRLAETVRGRICKEVEKISDIGGKYLVPSEYSIKSDVSLKTKILNELFEFIIFFAIPLIISIVCILK